MTYEELLETADAEGLIVMEKPLTGSNGRIYKNRIAIRSNIETTIEKSCTLSEELGHHFTTYGDILDQTDVQNRKQELRARTWAYNKMIGLSGIIKCFKDGCKSRYEMASCLDVTEEFLEEALDRYHQIYGSYTIYGKYIIYFEPNLTVLKMK